MRCGIVKSAKMWSDTLTWCKELPVCLWLSFIYLFIMKDMGGLAIQYMDVSDVNKVFVLIFKHAACQSPMMMMILAGGRSESTLRFSSAAGLVDSSPMDK